MLCPVKLLDNKKCLSALIVMSDLRVCCFHINAVDSALHPRTLTALSQGCIVKRKWWIGSHNSGDLHDLANQCHQH